MTIPYTYLLKCIPENKYYYGVKYAQNCNPKSFWIDYFTSSKEVHYLLEKYGKSAFLFEIRKTFKDEDSARSWEKKVIKRLKLHKHPLFLNKCCPGENFGFHSGLNNPMSNEKSIEKMRDSYKNHYRVNFGVEHPNQLPHHRERLSILATKRNKKQVKCPNCNKIGGLINMKRYHFDKCKKIINFKGEKHAMG